MRYEDWIERQSPGIHGHSRMGRIHISRSINRRSNNSRSRRRRHIPRWVNRRQQERFNNCRWGDMSLNCRRGNWRSNSSRGGNRRGVHVDDKVAMESESGDHCIGRLVNWRFSFRVARTRNANEIPPCCSCSTFRIRRVRRSGNSSPFFGSVVVIVVVTPFTTRVRCCGARNPSRSSKERISFFELGRCLHSVGLALEEQNASASSNGHGKSIFLSALRPRKSDVQTKNCKDFSNLEASPRSPLSKSKHSCRDECAH